MLKAFYTSATGMRAQEMLIDNTSNNLANVNTSGFKRNQIHFADLMYDVSKEPGATTSQNEIAPIGLQIGNGVQTVGTNSLDMQGTPNQTSQPTDMMIEGDGFFKILLSDGNPAYTRDGSFQRNANGDLTTAQGHLLDPPINIPINATQVTITQTGLVQFNVDGDTQDGGQIQIFRFPNNAGLKKIGNNLLTANDASGQEIQGVPGTEGRGSIKSGYLEGSNVQVVNELVSLITAQRAYEINSRAIRAGDEMLSTTSQIVR